MTLYKTLTNIYLINITTYMKYDYTNVINEKNKRMSEYSILCTVMHTVLRAVAIFN